MRSVAENQKTKEKKALFADATPGNNDPRGGTSMRKAIAFRLGKGFPEFDGQNYRNFTVP
jgi:hypothetical protein